MPAREGSTHAEVAAFERRLRRTGDRRLQENGDPTLEALLRQIDERRRRRLADPGGVRRDPGDPVAASAGAVEVETEGAVDGEGRPPGTILSIEHVGPYIRIFRLARPPGLTFRAGQYVKVNHGDGKRRSFSLASAPQDPHLELCIGLNPRGRLTPTLFSLRPGARVEIDPRPRGSFGLATSARRHLMVATGTGIAPLRSMVRDALRGAFDGELVILHGASHAHGLPYRDELTDLAASDPRVTYRPTVSRPAPGPVWPGRTGRVDPLAFEVARTLDPRDTHAYACGNPGMVAHVATELGRAGFSVSREAFD
jgi:ferredoxin-NADP reductase